jgi:apolipoprotein N-acyltransferase
MALLWAAVSGAAMNLALAPFDAWWLQAPLLAVLGLLCGLASPAAVLRPGQVAARAWMFGLGWFGAGWWWLFISLHRYGQMPAVLAGLSVALLAAAMALYPALALAGWARWHAASTSAWRRVAAWVAWWTLAELARGSWFGGFPWSALGYAHTLGPLAAWAPWTGVYGAGAVACAVGGALAVAVAAVVRGRRSPAGRGAARFAVPCAALAVALGLALIGRLLPQDFSRPAGRLSVSLIQTAVRQDEKFDAEHLVGHMDTLLRDVAAARGTLVVTPESAVPLPHGMVDPAWWRLLRQAVRQRPERAALVGVFLGDESRGYTNSMIGVSTADDPARGEAQVYRYGKRHLLPFGESIPPGFGWFVRALAIPLDSQQHGDSEAVYVAGGQRLRPLICYEDLFGEEIAVAAAVDEGDPRAATVFVNASNLAWFGRWMVQDQHLQFSRMRALEFQRPVVRATNTGATAVVDHRGRVTARLPPEVAGVLETTVDGRTGTTPYARWVHAAGGLWPLWAACAGLLALSLIGDRRRPTSRRRAAG